MSDVQLLCYSVGAYTGCVVLCGAILESLVQKACDSKNIKEDGLGPKITALKNAGVVKGHYQDLIEVSKFYRHKAAHPTSEIFNLEKANLAIGATLIFIEEVFTIGR